MACDATDLMASIGAMNSYGGEDLALIELGLLKSIALLVNPSAVVEPDPLIQLAVDSGFDRLNQQGQNMVEIEMLCQLSQI